MSSSDSSDSEKRPRHGFRADKYKDDEAIDEDNTDSEDEDSNEENLEDNDMGDFIAEDVEEEDMRNYAFYRNTLDGSSKSKGKSSGRGLREKDLIAQEVNRIKSAHNDYVERDLYIHTSDGVASTPIAQWRMSLIPTTASKKLYLVHVKPSKELYVVFFLAKKYFYNMEDDKSNYPTVYSAFFTNKGSGIIFVEAITPREVITIKNNVPNTMSQQVKMVPVDQMPGCLATPSRKDHLNPGQFVRIRRDNRNELYINDLAQVVSVDKNSSRVLVKLIPRIDYSGLEDNNDLSAQTELTKFKLRQAKTYRPPQEDFDINKLSESARNIVDDVKPKKLKGIPREAISEILASKNSVYLWDNAYFFTTFVYKYYPLDRVISSNLDIGVDEPTKFINGLDISQFERKIPHFENNMYHSLNMKASSAFNVDDIATVRDGEYAGLKVRILSHIDDAHLLVKPIEDEDIELQIEKENLMRFFIPGDHVKVTAGPDVNQTGEIVHIDTKLGRATLLLDTKQKTIDVSIGYLTKTHEINQGEKAIGNYQLFDFIVLTDQTTRGVIWRIENKTIYILMTNGQSRTTTLDGVGSKQKDKRVRDPNGRPIEVGQTVVVDTNEYKQIRAQVKHIGQDAIFLHNDSLMKYNGLFVVEPNDCQASTAPTSSSYAMPIQIGRTPQKKDLIGQTIMITSGKFKNQLATIKEADQTSIKVLMHTNSRQMSFNTKDQEGSDKSDSSSSMSSDGTQGRWTLVTKNESHKDPFSRVFGKNKGRTNRPQQQQQQQQPPPMYNQPMNPAYGNYNTYGTPYSYSPTSATPYGEAYSPYQSPPTNSPYQGTPSYSPDSRGYPQYDQNSY
ncbi:hypothetical protein TRFO_16918 [Tritrichomonas foetus]|uniref:KOW domain-containing protein n=1 Tax=Tritrichomonas foetus TaxID=1144522 RepID=A0A1J4KT58_9EUKA|nr:hypothetical protein TRFO_16918 [Tritrichomonas foetus]|eukprot:OHT12972.1 hypothetical protein TRFO_16918 [Tritrichomonas foetus]